MKLKKILNNLFKDKPIIIKPIKIIKLGKKERLILHIPEATPQQLHYFGNFMTKHKLFIGSLIIGGQMNIKKCEKRK
uniref:Uncharacterized protein n=1 Tax=viral metagenome TaxID=1070528 RepID=A0A6M3IGT2_9ZZZZ